MNPGITQQSTSSEKKISIKSNQLVKPFLKWAGGKRQLIPVIKDFIPEKYSRYYEPFVGAGAILFWLQPKKATINDINYELINCYRAIKENPEELLTLCQEHKALDSKEHYYELRAKDRSKAWKTIDEVDVDRAARIIYLNKTCFNGLFRVNSRGQFNVPYGNYSNPSIADTSLIKAVSAYLNQANVSIMKGDFETAVETAKEKDFIYFDPPYHPISKTSSFTGYSINGFGEKEQERLRDTCNQLSDRGCHVLISNSNAGLIRELYDDDPRYEIVDVRASRSINALGSKRGKISEVLIYNKYECKHRLIVR